MIAIYNITNCLNGKPYVGQTRQPIEKRFIQHAKANTPLVYAMRTCWLENFTIEIIERCETQAQANERERFRIRVLDCKIPHGYNRSNGGEGSIHKPKSSSAKKVDGMLIRRLKELRFLNEITQSQFARALGVAQQTVGSRKKKNSSPGYEFLKKIADYFNVTTDYLLGRDTQSAPPLSLKQRALINGFDGLNADGQKTLMNVLAGLREVFPAENDVGNSKSREKSVIQKNRNGNNYFGIIGGNFNSTVSEQ